MARLPRYVLPGQPQHIIQRGNNRQNIFFDNSDFEFFRDAVVSAAEQHGLAIHAYVWMSNHIHLLATPEHEQSIGKTLQSVGRKYVQYFNHKYQRTGSLWEGRYRATVVDSESYLMTLMRYIELNPVRAGVVSHPREYPWSSFARNADGEQGPNADWITPHDQYQRLARSAEKRLVAYRSLFKGVVAREDMSQIRDCTNKGWVLGSEKFKALVEKLTERPASSKGVGRPRTAEA